MKSKDEGLPLSDDVYLKHLELIQSIINRMSSSSAQSKSWLLPVVTATFGYALTQQSPEVAVLGMVSVVLFGYMDASYLRQEQRFRELYCRVANRDPEVFPMNLNPGAIITTTERDVLFRKQLWSTFKGWWFKDPRVWFSWSIAPFYGGFLIAGAFVIFCSLGNQ